MEEIEKRSQDDEISLIDLFSVLWRRKVMIMVMTGAATAGAVVFSVISLVLPPENSPLPNVYTPQALMLINNSSSAGGGLSSMLSSSGMGGLASLAGVSLPSSSTYSDLAVFLVSSNSFLDAAVDRFGLIERYEITEHPRAESREALKKLLTAEYDTKSGVLSIGFTDRDPAFAQEVVNYCTASLEQRFSAMGLDKNKIEKENLELSIENTFSEIGRLEEAGHRLERSSIPGALGSPPAITIEMNRIAMELEAQRQIYTQLKVQYELLKVNMAGEKPVFQILELAEIPDRKSGPSRGLICIIVVFAAAFLGVFLAFMLNALENIRKDPAAMAKLRGSL
jgi:uncharacterized protein involved in exopolysaccharide biosynthesis